jgi:DNA-directed RNA polymerase specialized sigma24 family protein
MFTGVSPAGYEPAGHQHLDKDLLLRDALNKLDRMDREVLLLREFERLSYAEMAILLRLPINTVRSRLFRARSELRNLLSAPPVVSATQDPQATQDPKATQELTRSEGRA